MNLFFYCAISAAFLGVVLVLFRGTRATVPDEAKQGSQPALDLTNGQWLPLSERIYDPADVRWLAEELSLPHLAHALTASRKRLAICWLEALQSSFHELVRTPQSLVGEESAIDSAGGWQILWFTLRFKFSISYALLVVKWFGPYHRLIPSFSWVPFPQFKDRTFRKPAFAGNRSQR